MGKLMNAAIGALTGGIGGGEFGGTGGWAGAGMGALKGAAGINPGTDDNRLIFHILNGLADDPTQLASLLEKYGLRSKSTGRIGPIAPTDSGMMGP